MLPCDIFPLRHVLFRNSPTQVLLGHSSAMSFSDNLLTFLIHEPLSHVNLFHFPQTFPLRPGSCGKADFCSLATAHLHICTSAPREGYVLICEMAPYQQHEPLMSRGDRDVEWPQSTGSEALTWARFKGWLPPCVSETGGN